MGMAVSEWLAREFAVFGIHFQNWMLLALAIVVVCVLFQWFKGSYRDRN
jgi:disulfide bond formation protein DsbB